MPKKPFWPGAFRETDQMAADREMGLTDGQSGDDVVLPFQVEGLDVRGRVIRLGSMLDDMLDRHNYPEPVAKLLAEAVTLTVLLGSSLKFEGKLILQTQSDGPVNMLVADFSTPGSVRGYARYDEEKLARATKNSLTEPGQLIGSGVLALTIDQGPDTQRYQGIVRLDGKNLEEAATVYFQQSEQLPSEVRLAVAKQIIPSPHGAVEKWRAGGLLAQYLPKSTEPLPVIDFPSGKPEVDADSVELTNDAWKELVALVATIEASELIDPELTNETLLYRLFHEHGVRVFEGKRVRDDCSCSREKIHRILSTFSPDEISDSIENDVIRVDCEFCSASYEFEPSGFLVKGRKTGKSL